MHQSSFEKMRQFKETYLDKNKELRILDLGSKSINGSYKEIFSEPNWTYEGADMEPGENVDILLPTPYDWKSVQSNYYDVVVSGQAFEHIEYFWISILQINRVLKLGGISCIIAPSAGKEHRFPTDCWRFYCDGMNVISKWGKLDPIEITTQKEDGQYTDGSNQWKDSILVCVKNQNVSNIEQFIDITNSWMHLESSQEIKQTLQDFRFIQETEINKEKLYEFLAGKIKTTGKDQPNWYSAMLVILDVYKNRKDLQDSFPEVQSQGNLLPLVKWAVKFGIHKETRIKQFSDVYKQFLEN